VQKFVRMIKDNPLYAASAVLIVIVVVFALLQAGGGPGGGENDQAARREKAKKKAVKPQPKGRRVKPAPTVSSGVVDEARREGAFVVAQARGTIRNPGQVRVRVSASPKQRVTVDWQLSCYHHRKVKVGRGSYRTKAPDTRSISVPMSGADTCIAIAGAQLTRYGTGRVKVAVVAG
jgi:hypothetical protein